MRDRKERDGGLSGAHEDAQGQAQCPEHDGAAGVQEEDAEAGDDHRAQGQDDDLLRADLSSTQPKATVARPATMFAAIAKIMTCPAVKPKAVLASTAPKVKTPARPSRKTAEAMRKKRVCGASFLRCAPCATGACRSR